MRAVMLALILYCVGVPVWSQDALSPNPEIANCQEIKDEASTTQAELCSTYLPCKMIFTLQKACTGAKRFLTRLQDSIGEGTRTLFGRRKEVTPDALFAATLSDTAVRAGQSPEWKTLAAPVNASVAKAGDTVLQGAGWVYVGDVRGGTANGAGTMVTNAGEVQRGSFKDGKLDGRAEIVNVDGQRKVGTYAEGSQNGYGMDVSTDGTQYRSNWAAGQRNGKTEYTTPDGLRFSGMYKDGQKLEGTVYRTDGSKVEQGSYNNGELEIGQRFDARGQILTDVNKPRDRFLADQARTAQSANLPALDRTVPKAQERTEAVANTLNQLSAGELFVKADELRQSGDSAGAQKHLRALVSRFPDHELGKLAANRMTKGWSGATSQPVTAASGKPANVTANGGGDATTRCKAALSALDAEQTKVAQIKRPQGTVATMRGALLFMQQYLSELNRSCAGAKEVEQLRTDMERSYKAAETACKQIASGVCTPGFD